MGHYFKGINPNGEPIPDEPYWLDDSEYSEEQKKAYYAWQDNTPGAYFRNDVWHWRPLWNFVCEVCDDILTQKDMKEGSSNNGHKISKTKAKKIAARLRKVDKDLEKHQIDHERRNNNLPDEKCKLCGGTGKRALNEEERLFLKNVPGGIHCDDCNGKGIQSAFDTNYYFRADNVRAFAEFCEYSGGFVIC